LGSFFFGENVWHEGIITDEDLTRQPKTPEAGANETNGEALPWW
jgi:hypothetical protein